MHAPDAGDAPRPGGAGAAVERLQRLNAEHNVPLFFREGLVVRRTTSGRSGWPSRAAWLRLLPFLAWRHRVDGVSLRADLAAGFTGSLILVPQGVAFATIAGMPPQYGLYAAMVPGVVAALFGSSWQLVSGPTTAISLVVFASLSPLAEPGSADFVRLAIALSFLSGVLMLALGLLRLGALMNFVSHTVVVGFTAGAGVLIAASQLRNFTGLPIPRGATLTRTVEVAATTLPQLAPWVTLVAVATLLASILSRRIWPRIPNMVVGLLAGSLLAAALTAWLGAERVGIATLASLPRGLPPLSLPLLEFDSLRPLIPIAVAVALLSLTEALSIARALALRTGQRIDANQEFVGQGLSNLAGSFFSAYPSSGSFNRSGLNLESGARTPLAAVFASLLLVVIVQFVAPLAAWLPLPAMAGVLFLVAWKLIDLRQIRQIARSSRQEAAILAVTFFATLFLNLEFAIFVGVLLSLLLYLHRTSRPSIDDVKPVASGDDASGFSADTGLPDCPQMKILRLQGSVFFGAVEHVGRALAEVDARDPGQKFVLLTCPGVNFVDLAGSQMLTEEARRRAGLGGALFLAQLRKGPLGSLRASGHGQDLGQDLRTDDIVPAGVADPVGRIFGRLDPEVCRTCTARIFVQCAGAPGAELRAASGGVHPLVAGGARAAV